MAFTFVVLKTGAIHLMLVGLTADRQMKALLFKINPFKGAMRCLRSCLSLVRTRDFFGAQENHEIYC